MNDISRAAPGFIPLAPPSGRFWLHAEDFRRGRDGKIKPSFSTSVVATAFFGRSAAWMRKAMRPDADRPAGSLILDGRPFSVARSEADDRKFSLVDIERVAHALRQQDVIDDARLAAAVASVVSCAVSYKIIPAPWPAERAPASAEASPDE
jgi:hypothetical protein